MAYAETSLIVNGALEESETFHDYALLEEYVHGAEEDAKGHGYPTELFVLEHDHDELEEDEECACVQYLTDHRPAHSWNTDS